MEAALQVYEEMPAPNLAAYNAVIDVCARAVMRTRLRTSSRA